MPWWITFVQRRDLFYAIAWQGVWFASVGGAGAGLPWLGPAAALPVLLLGAWGRWCPARRLGLAALGCGLVIDGGLNMAGLVQFSHGYSLLPPPWMLLLWPLFALALLGPLAWIRSRPWLPAVLGALAAPGAYVGGQALGALTMPQGTVPVVLVVAVGYAAATHLLTRIRP